MGKLIGGGIALALVGAWVWLFLSGQGLLIGSTIPKDKDVGMLECRYFTGTSVVERKHLFTRVGLGRDTCPRVVDVTK